jgi:GNAT superfamily N-acetyltransferase
MREFIKIVETTSDQPYINAHRASPNTVEIEILYIPLSMRGRGIGRKYFEDWVKDLPNHIHYIVLWAADTGKGRSNHFWEALGFDYQYECANELDINKWWMIKGIHGHPTPSPKPLED